MRAFWLIALVALSGCRFDVDARSLAPGELRGRLFIRDDQAAMVPVSKAVIRLSGGLTARSDDKGLFVLRGLAEGRYALTITWDPDADGTVDAGLVLRDVAIDSSVLGAGGRDLGRLVIGKAGAIEGTLTDNAQPGIGEAVLQGNARKPLSDGHFRFATLLPGSYDLGFLLGRGALPLRVVEVEPGRTTTVDVVLDDDLTTTGTVSGRAILLDQSTHGGIEVALSPTLVADTDQQGLYLHAGVAAGIVDVVAREPGYVAAVYPHVLVGGDVVLPTLALQAEETACGAADPDGDFDGDGVPNGDESPACRCDPFGATDLDDDGLCGGDDRDDDGDGVNDDDDNCPELDNDQSDRDDDGLGDACDPEIWIDSPAPTFAITRAWLTVEGGCVAGVPLVVTVDDVTTTEVLRSACTAEGLIDLRVRYHGTAGERRLTASQVVNGTTLASTIVGTLSVQIHDVSGNTPQLLADAITAANDGDILSLPATTFAFTGPFTITRAVVIDADSAATTTFRLDADLPDNTDAASAWILVPLGVVASLHAVTFDGTTHRVRGGAVRVLGRARHHRPPADRGRRHPRVLGLLRRDSQRAQAVTRHLLIPSAVEKPATGHRWCFSRRCRTLSFPRRS